MRFLVTGGAGFIGSHIVQYLLNAGHYVRVLDNLFSGKKENLAFASSFPADQFDLIIGDIRDKDILDRACSGIDFISHQAALRSVPKSMKEPQIYNDVNINGTLYILQAAANHKIKRVVFASSSSVYGDTTIFPQSEKAYPLLISPYALSKLAGEYYCRIFAEHFGVETVALRYFNVFGPRQALDDEYAVVIPKFIHCIMHNQQPPIFGTGKQSRDFTFIDNVVQANVKAALTAGIKHEVLNVAAGQDHTVLELVEELNAILKKNIQPEFLPVRAGDVFRTCADISLIKARLGFEPAVSFNDGLRRTAAWFASL